MQIEQADKIEGYLTLVDSLHHDGWIYRGVSDKAFTLIPKVGRESFKAQYSLGNERLLLKIFKQRAVRYITYQPSSEMEWLALGQHHGLPTRLLDWSTSPLVALFFAVAGLRSTDAAVYCRHMSRGTNEFEPFTITTPQKYYPPALSPRIPAQHALFSVESDPTVPMNHSDIVKIIIPHSARQDMRKRLSILGFNQESMFPDLDGICDHLSWRMENNIGSWRPKGTPRP